MIFVARHGIGMVSATVAEGEFLRTVEPARALARTTTGASTTTMRSLQAARCGRARARWALCRAGESRGDAAPGPHRACSGPAPTGRVPDRHEGEKVASPLGICGGESRSGEPPVHTAGALVQGMRELSVPRAVTPPGSEEVAVRIELLDLEVVGVRDVDVPARVGRHAGRKA